MSSSLHVRAGLDDGVRPANHWVQVGAGRNHRVDGVFLLDPEIDDDRAGMRARLVDSRGDLAALTAADPANAERLGKLDEVRSGQRRRGIAAFVEELLP